MSKFIFPATDGAGVFCVPACVVDFHMADAEDCALRTLLYILRRSEGFDAADACHDLGISPDAFERSVEFWLTRGVLTCRDGVVTLDTACITVSGRPMPIESRTCPEYDFAEISKTVEQNSDLRALIRGIQPFFAKPLGAASLKSVYMFYDYYGFSVEVIFQLISYCTGLGHDNFKYIEQVALEWYSSGITTEERVSKYLAERERKRKSEYAVRRIFGIGERNFSKKEKALIVKWTDAYGFGEDMLEAAFDRCVASAGKLSFAYIDRIMEKWASAGIKTPADADAADEAFESKKPAKKAKSKAAPTRGEKTYEVGEFEDWSFNTLYADDKKEEDK